jgi:hypothetical protein
MQGIKKRSKVDEVKLGQCVLDLEASLEQIYTIGDSLWFGRLKFKQIQ